MEEILKNASAQVAVSRPAKPSPSKTARVPGTCSKTGKSIVFLIGFFNAGGIWEGWQLIDILEPPQSQGTGSPSTGQLETFPAFGPGDRSAWCKACHIRIKNGPNCFLCCDRLQCMGSFYMQDKEIHVFCKVCKEGATLSGFFEIVKGTSDPVSSRPSSAPTKQVASNNKPTAPPVSSNRRLS